MKTKTRPDKSLTRGGRRRVVPEMRAARAAVRRHIQPYGTLCFLLLLLAFSACTADTRQEENPLLAPPIGVKVTAAEALQWGYQHRLSADLDGDGIPESVSLSADVQLAPSGQPLWEDGHRWALAVASNDRTTLAYSAFVPHGFVEAAVLRPSSEGKRDVLVLERSADQLRALAVSYTGAGTATSASGAYYQIESWLPGFARLSE